MRGVPNNFATGSKENDFEAMIDFENTDDDVLEFRVHKSGNVSFEYKGARLLRL